MNRLYRKNEILFAIVWIVIYVAGFSAGDNLSSKFGLEKSVTIIVGAVLIAVICVWLKRNDLLQSYGLCRGQLPAKELLYYIPLMLLVSVNLWFGITWNYGVMETLLYVFSMLFVGFLEEIIFRGFLFKAMYKTGEKSAIIVSSITFGIGHIVNLINGSGVDLFSNLLQVLYAIAGGFLFTILFLKSKSLWACIIAHGCLNALSVFANESSMTTERTVLSAMALIVISVSYAIYICKRVKVY